MVHSNEQKLEITARKLINVKKKIQNTHKLQAHDEQLKNVQYNFVPTNIFLLN